MFKNNITKKIAILFCISILIFLIYNIFIQKSDNNTKSDNNDKTELVDKKTEYSNTYDNHDGTYTLESYAAPVNYYDKTTGSFKALAKGSMKNIIDEMIPKVLATDFFGSRDSSIGTIAIFACNTSNDSCTSNYTGMRNATAGYKYVYSGRQTFPGVLGGNPYMSAGFTYVPKFTVSSTSGGLFGISDTFEGHGTLMRSFLNFDTRNIPDDAIFNDARITLYDLDHINIYAGTEVARYHIVKSYQTNSSDSKPGNLSISDFTKLNINDKTGDSYGYFTIPRTTGRKTGDTPAGSRSASLYTPTLNTLISKTGYTKLAVIEEHDLNQRNSYVSIQSFFGSPFATSPRNPKLTVNYKTSPTIGNFDWTDFRTSCNNDCKRYYTMYWSKSSGAYSYILEEKINGYWYPRKSCPANASYSSGCYYDRSDQVGINYGPDDGTTTRVFRIMAISDSSFTTTKVSSERTASPCNPIIKNYRISNCVNNSAKRVLNWDKCFADNSYSIVRKECSLGYDYYIYHYQYSFTSGSISGLNGTQQSQVLALAKSKLDSINADYQNLNVSSSELQVKLKNYNDENSIKSGIISYLRNVGHYAETEYRTNMPIGCAVTCNGTSKTFTGSGNSFTDQDFNPEKYHDYILTIRNGSRTKSATVQGIPCLAGKLKLQYDENIVKNPPPGFGDIFGPIYDELVP